VKTRASVVVLSAGLLTIAAARPPQSPPSPVFHHVHLRVADPAAAMGRFVREHRCEEVIVSRLGPGVRCGASYILFERQDEPPAAAPARGWVSVSGKGDRARVRVRIAVPDAGALTGWLRDSLGAMAGAAVTLVDVDQRRRPPDEIAHIGYSASDVAAVTARWQRSPAQFLRGGVETTLVAAPGGLGVEIVSGAADGPDAFWCPMHPDVRSAVAGECERCHMTLVPIPPPVYGNYLLRTGYASISPTRGRLTLRVLDPVTQQAVRTFLPVHERALHLFVVSRDLSFFDHVHPVLDDEGLFAVDLSLPGPGVYAIYADTYPATGTPQFLQTLLVTPDYRGPLFAAPASLPVGPATTTVEGLRITLAAGRQRTGEPLRLTFTVEDAATGRAVADLEPYLGAPGHLLIVSADLETAFHSHPSDLQSRGPVVGFDATLPRAGVYKLWLQIQRAGRVVTVPMTLDVASSTVTRTRQSGSLERTSNLAPGASGTGSRSRYAGR
jgi:hypothetical protein